MTFGNEAVAKQREFEAAYVFAKPFVRHANGCSLQTAAFLEHSHPGFSVGRHAEDLCLYVFLERPMPDGMQYPKEFGGMPVVTRVVGDIREEEPVYESRDEV